MYSLLRQVEELFSEEIPSYCNWSHTIKFLHDNEYKLDIKTKTRLIKRIEEYRIHFSTQYNPIRREDIFPKVYNTNLHLLTPTQDDVEENELTRTAVSLAI